jgi:hypothetical protein
LVTKTTAHAAKRVANVSVEFDPALVKYFHNSNAVAKAKKIAATTKAVGNLRVSVGFIALPYFDKRGSSLNCRRRP